MTFTEGDIAFHRFQLTLFDQVGISDMQRLIHAVSDSNEYIIYETVHSFDVLDKLISV
jgi:hypothetical protein